MTGTLQATAAVNGIVQSTKLHKISGSELVQTIVIKETLTETTSTVPLVIDDLSKIIGIMVKNTSTVNMTSMYFDGGGEGELNVALAAGDVFLIDGTTASSNIINVLNGTGTGVASLSIGFAGGGPPHLSIEVVVYLKA